MTGRRLARIYDSMPPAAPRPDPPLPPGGRRPAAHLGLAAGPGARAVAADGRGAGRHAVGAVEAAGLRGVEVHRLVRQAPRVLGPRDPSQRRVAAGDP